MKETFLQRLFQEQIYTETDAEARVWDDGKNCNFLVLTAPETGLQDGRVHTRTAARAHAGTVVGNTCLSIIKWNGFIEIFQEPVLGTTPGVVEFVVVDSKIYSDDGQSQGIIGTLWDWIKNYVHPRFNRVRLDIYPVLNDLKGMLALVFPARDEGVMQILDSVTLSNVMIANDYIELGIQFHVPGQSRPVIKRKPEPVLTPEELASWEKHWQDWDAFLTQVIKKAGGDTELGGLRIALLAVLLDSRQDLVEILMPTSPSTTDPVPDLFVKSWEQLSPVMQDISMNLPGSSVFSYLGFITSANALTAINAIEEDTGFAITPDALRRLVRMIAPVTIRDPLFFDTSVDQELRSLFGFGPLPAPPEVDPSSINIPETGASGETGRTEMPGLFGGIQAGMLMIFIPAMAIGNDAYNMLVNRLNRRVPTINSLNEYLPLVQLLLDLTAHSTSRQKLLDEQFEEIYRPLVLATAWQESCWRQFIKVNGEIIPIQSSAGAVGIMQVNQHVWRGFYDTDSLQNDVGYNALAGSEILYHYLTDYAIAKGEHRLDGGKENLVRATYAMYNGGPKHISRYRREQVPSSLRAIDNAFWKKFEIMRTGNILAVSSCYTG